MEYAPNGNLSDYLKKKGPIAEMYAKVYMRQLSDVLKYLLTRPEPIIHRDLKPQNILIFGEYTIKLTDFGFARNFQVDDMFNTFCGTPLYMAPELLLPCKDKSNKKYTSKVDLWSIGIILYEMLTGKIPSYSKTVSQLSTKLRDGDFKLPASIKISSECRDLLERLLIKDPLKRIEWNDFFIHSWFNNDELMEKENNLIQQADDMMATNSSISQSSAELLKKFSSNMNSTVDSRLPTSKPKKELSDLHDSLQELHKSFYLKNTKPISIPPKNPTHPIDKLSVSPDLLTSPEVIDAQQKFPSILKNSHAQLSYPQIIQYNNDADDNVNEDVNEDVNESENELFFSCDIELSSTDQNDPSDPSDPSYLNDPSDYLDSNPQLPKTNIPIEKSQICNLLDAELSLKFD
jgi:serine/threonine protein kinase